MIPFGEQLDDFKIINETTVIIVEYLVETQMFEIKNDLPELILAHC